MLSVFNIIHLHCLAQMKNTILNIVSLEGLDTQSIPLILSRGRRRLLPKVGLGTTTSPS